MRPLKTDVRQTERDALEREYWLKSSTERPGDLTLENLTNKFQEVGVVLHKMRDFEAYLSNANTIIGVGGGQCVMSCLIKKRYPAATVFGSDIAPGAVVSAREWQRILEVGLDGTFACRSYGLPVRESSVDVIVVFAAAHHFGAHRKTFAELQRVLKPGGRALYLHEPGCRRYLHTLARRRVMGKRPVVPEDVLVYTELISLARAAGLCGEVIFAPLTINRGVVETLYYYVLGKLRPLQHVLPCTVDLVFTKT